MSLSPGTRIGPYETGSLLGAGGMGEVYRARDSRLGRDVALKILSGPLASDGERMERFQREAMLLASLNHPHIAAIYGLEESGGVRALAMELVPGPTLADRIAQSRLPLPEALDIARQIAEAFEYAHEHGVIHRDLKPANVKITPEGSVKVLDFGLAKAVEQSPAAVDAANSPTLTLAATQAGVILGTAAYMSPEQAAGRTADKRADIWSFGVVLWEMLTGLRLFDGETVAHTLADVLRAPVDLDKIPASTPPPVRDLVRRCLDRDVKSRLRDIGEARIALQQAQATPPSGSAPRIEAPPAAAPKPYPLYGLIVALAAALGLVSVIHFREKPPEPQTVRFGVLPPEKVTMQWFDMPAISPDGRNLAFTGSPVQGAIGISGSSQLWLRLMDSMESRAMAGSEGAFLPFWSPDSRFVAFYGRGKLRKMDLTGGPPVTLADLGTVGGFRAGGAWSQRGVILVGTSGGPLLRLPAAGGEPKPVRSFDTSRGENSQAWPQFLPDGNHFLYVSRGASSEKSGVYAGSLDSDSVKRVLTGESPVLYAPPGYLLYARNETLMAQAFDAGALEVTGEPFPVSERVGRMATAFNIPGTLFTVSNTGTLVYRGAGVPDLQLVWFSREGRRLGTAGGPGVYRQFVLSPDESRVVIEQQDGGNRTWDLWQLELRSGILSRLTSDPGDEADPVWSPDGRQVVFNSNRAKQPNQLDLYRKTIGNDPEELLLKNSDRKVAEGWLKDGSIVYTNLRGQRIFRLRPGGQPEVLFENEFTKDEMRVSPDERSVAYGSSESGRWEIYLAQFPSFAERRQISANGGGQAFWRKDGREIYFLGLDGKMMAAEVKPGAALETGVPRVLFETRVRTNPLNDQYAAAADGSKFLVLEPVDDAPRPMTVVLNWFAKAPP